MEPVVSAFLSQGIIGAVALVAFAFGYVMYRAQESRTSQLISQTTDYASQVIAAHKLRAEDSRTMLVDCTRALQSSAEASEAQVEALRELRDTLRAIQR